MKIKFNIDRNGCLYSFSSTDGHCEVIEEFIIPSKIKGREVSSIGQLTNSFRELRGIGVKKIENLIIEDGIKFINNYAFSNIKLEIDNFYWPTSCTEIPAFCFDGSYIERVKGIENVKFVGKDAFSRTQRLIEINWPQHCFQIPAECFSYSRIEKISGIENVTQIKKSAFATTDLKSFTWPKGCFSVPEKCFCDSILENINGLEAVKTIGQAAFANTNLKSIKWPTKCKHIPEGCFCNSPIKSISNINRVTRVSNSAFEKTKLKTIIWPTSCAEIPFCCFYNTPLKEIKEIDNVREIGEYAFARTNLKTITWPSNCEKIPYNCFENSSLEEIIFSNYRGIKDIDLYNLYSFIYLSGNNIKKIDLSAVGAVNFIETRSNVDYKKLLEKMESIICFPYYVIV